MNMPTRTDIATRTYQQTARAEKTQDTRDRISSAAMELFFERYLDEITIKDVAAAAGVSHQTVINHFGSKGGVVAAVLERMPHEVDSQRHRAVPGDVDSVVRATVADYERTGDAIVRAIALEERLPELPEVLEIGRRGHREWVRDYLGPALDDGLGEYERVRALDLLVVATDVLTWKLLRRERGLSRPVTTDHMCELVLAIINQTNLKDGARA